MQYLQCIRSCSKLLHILTYWTHMTSLKLVQRILVFGTTSRKWLLGYFMGLSGRVNVFPYYKCGDWGTENLGVLARSRGMAGKAEQVRYCQRHSPDRQLWLGASLTALRTSIELHWQLTLFQQTALPLPSSLPPLLPTSFFLLPFLPSSLLSPSPPQTSDLQCNCKSNALTGVFPTLVFTSWRTQTQRSWRM